MIKDSINFYNNYQYLNLRCYSCGSKNHITLYCHKFHTVFDKKNIIQKYLEADKEFRKSFKRQDRRRFNARIDIEEAQEAASQIQVIQQNELYYESLKETDVQYYSEGEEILDKNVYNPQPITYTVEPIQTKTINLPIESRSQSLLSLQQVVNEKPRRRTPNELGEVHSFALTNYDSFYHNLNLDKVRNFEVYYPNNNITKLIVEHERRRLEKVVHMRLSFNAKHIGPLLVKSFRMNERRKTREAYNSQGSLNSSQIANIMSGKRRRSSKTISGVNPSDITFYNSPKKNSVDFSNQRDSDHGEGSYTGPKRFSLSHYKATQMLGNTISPSSITDPNFQSIKIHYSKEENGFEGGNEDIPAEKGFNFNNYWQPPRRKSNSKMRFISDENGVNFSGTSEHSDFDSGDSDSRTQNVFSSKLKVSGSQFKSETFSRPLLGSSIDQFSGTPSPFHLRNKGNHQTKQLDNSYDVIINSRKNSSEGMRLSSRPRLSSQVRASLLGGTNFFDEASPSVSFDFSKQMNKLSQKLDENKSLNSRSTGERESSTKKAIEGNLMSILLKERNIKYEPLRKGRSVSEDKGREIEKVIEEYGIEKIFTKTYNKNY